MRPLVCVACGYTITEAIPSQCSECGTPVQIASRPKSTNQLPLLCGGWSLGSSTAVVAHYVDRVWFRGRIDDLPYDGLMWLTLVCSASVVVTTVLYAWVLQRTVSKWVGVASILCAVMSGVLLLLRYW